MVVRQMAASPLSPIHAYSMSPPILRTKRLHAGAASQMPTVDPRLQKDKRHVKQLLVIS